MYIYHNALVLNMCVIREFRAYIHLKQCYSIKALIDIKYIGIFYHTLVAVDVTSAANDSSVEPRLENATVFGYG